MKAIRDHRGVRDIDCGTIWVCWCCLLSHANAECCADDSHGGDGVAPWSDLDDRYRVTMGTGHGAEECGEGDDCDCDRIVFSRERCEGCGSGLAGERHAFTLWRARRRFRTGL